LPTQFLMKYFNIDPQAAMTKSSFIYQITVPKTYEKS
jgi:hypothetical protein